VEEDYTPDSSPQEEVDEATSLRRTPKRRIRGSSRLTKSPEPEFVMPSLEVTSFDGSWAESTGRNTRNRNGIRISERLQESRGVSRSQNNGSPEKRRRTKTTTARSAAPIYTTYPNLNSLSLSGVTLNHTTDMLSWLFDVLSAAMRILKIPISYLLAVWLLFGLGTMVRNLVTTSVYQSLTPVCRIPGASLLNLPFCPVHLASSNSGSPPQVEFNQLMAVQANFEKVLEESAGGATLPLDMKRGEASIRDLRQLVRYSGLHSRYVHYYIRLFSAINIAPLFGFFVYCHYQD
jgi:hypothetical protein